MAPRKTRKHRSIVSNYYYNRHTTVGGSKSRKRTDDGEEMDTGKKESRGPTGSDSEEYSSGEEETQKQRLVVSK